MHYNPIIQLCRLILSNSSLGLESSGKVKFSSFLIDMNILFENFVIGVLKSRLSKKLKIKKGTQAWAYSDEQKKTRMRPDMIIKKGKKPSVIIDAKYKHNITDEDLNQIWIYSLVHLLPVSILVYPIGANPALTPFNFKAKECKVDTSPNPVSCKGLKKMINGDTFDLQLSRDDGKIVITLFPTESIRTP